jgi:hypothetical protein
MLSGFEDTREDVRGLSAGVWKKLTIWGMRLAVICGVVLFVMAMIKGERPFAQPHLMFKLGIGAVLILLCENAPKSLMVGKRGSAMLTLMLFILISFMASNHSAFLVKPEPPAPESDPSAVPPAPAPEAEPPVVIAVPPPETVPPAVPAAQQQDAQLPQGSVG